MKINKLGMAVFAILICILSCAYADIVLHNPDPSSDVLSMDVNSQFGTAINGFSVVVPPGINNIQPQINLVYVSNQQQGIIGVGWSLDLGSIERSLKFGTPGYSTTDNYILTQQGSRTDLVFDNQAQGYRPKIEGAFIKIKKVNDSWQATDRQGTIYYYGTNASARLFDPSQTDHIFKWYLEQVVDVHGNYLTISYNKDTTGNQVYPLTIVYTGNKLSPAASPLQPFASVEFQTQARSISHQTYAPGFLIKTLQRISKIVVKAGGTEQREYRLTYTPSQGTTRDLLTSIQEFDASGTNGKPAVSFTYYDNSKGFALNSQAVIPADARFSNQAGGVSPYQDLGVRIFDVNGDGYPDLIRDYVAVSTSNVLTHTKEAFINNKNNTWTLNTAYNLPGTCVNDSSSCATFVKEVNTLSHGKMYVDFGLLVADLDSDGYSDIVEKQKFSIIKTQPNNNYANIGQIVYGYKNSPAGWSQSTQWGLPSDLGLMLWATVVDGATDSYRMDKLGNIAADVNNDGFIDFVTSHKIDNTNTSNVVINVLPWKNVFLNLSGHPNGTWSRPDNDYTDFSKGAILVDLNGDGLPDIFYNDGTTVKVFMNTGYGWAEDTQSPWLNTQGIGNLNDNSTQLADINGDGLPDMIVAKGDINSGSRVLINTGAGWVRDDQWILPNGNFVNLGTRLLDANADTMMDFMINYNGNTSALYLNQGKPADLLASINNNCGGVTTYVYGSSAEFTQTFMPFAIPVIKSMTRSNSLGDTYTTQYKYENGLWNPANNQTVSDKTNQFSDAREFRGFGKVTVTDTEGNRLEQEFNQDYFLNGRIKTARKFSTAGQLTETTYKWNLSTLNADDGINFVYLNEQTECSFNSSQVKKCSKVRFTYNEAEKLGNLTHISYLGEVDAQGNSIGNNHFDVYVDYVNNTTNNMLGFPSVISVRDYSGVLFRKTMLSYDGQANGIAPTNGFLSKVEQWAGDQQGTVNPVTTYTYDAFGNLLTATDPLGKTTTVTYDSTFNLFPLSTKNPLNQVVSQEYYGINNVPLDGGNGFKGLWGQIKSSTDANNQKIQNTYDVFGRLTATVSPLDSISYPTTSYQYLFMPNYRKTTMSQRITSGQPGTLDSFEFSDGLGRVIQTKSPSAQAGQFIVNGQTTYNSRGLPEQKYLPFFSTNPVDTIEAVNSGRAHSVIIYDALGRVIKSVNPDQTYSSVEYDNWTIRNIDENGHKQEADFDAFGRLSQKREYKGADGRFASVYPSAAYSLYATTQYLYDSEGNPVKITDTEGNITTIAYDNLGRKTSMTDPDMGLWKYNYDLNGNLITQTDAKNHVINFQYDDINRLKSKSDGQDINNTYTYDDQLNAVGRLTNITFNGGARQFQYDALGRINQSLKTIGGSVYHVKYDYNSLNNINSIEYPDYNKVFYKYNSAGQPQGAASDPTLLGPQSFNYVPSQTMWSKIKSGLRDIGKEIVSVFLVTDAYADTTMDYTTFSKQDPGSKITVSSSCLSFSNIETRSANSYVYKASPTSGDFKYEFDTILTTSDSWAGDFAVWGITNNSNTAFNTWTSGIYLAWNKFGLSPSLKLITLSPAATSNSISLSMNTRYYMRISRAVSKVTLDIYSDSARTTKITTVTNPFGSGNFSYIYGLSTQNTTATGYKATGDVCRLVSGLPADTQAPAAPSTVTLGSPTSGSLTLSWSGATDNVAVTGYKIDISTSNVFTTMLTGYNNLDVGNVSTKSITGLTSGTTYYARVRAYDAAGNVSANSSSATGTTSAAGDTQAPTAPTTISLSTPTLNSLTLTWSGATDNVGVTGYRVDVSTNSAFTSMVTGYNNFDAGNVSNTTITGLIAGTAYYARVRAYDAAGNISSNSSIANATTTADTQAPAAPATVTLSNPTASALTLSWNSSTDNVAVAGYKIDVSTNNTFTAMVTGYNNLDAGNVTSKSIAGLNASTTYYARVRAYDAAGNVSSNSSSVTGTTSSAADTQAPSAPTTVTLGSPTSSTLTLSWSGAIDNVAVTGYKIDISTSSAFTTMLTGYNNLDVGNVLSKSITGLSTNTMYYARIRAYDAAANISSNSSTATGTTSAAADTQAPTVPAIITLASPTLSSLSLSWSGATDNVGVTGYKIDVSTNNIFTSPVTGYSNLDVGNVLNKSITGLTAGTTYYARVRAYDAAGNISSNSAVASATTTTDTQAPSAPTTIIFGSPTVNALTLTWSGATDNAGVTGYKIDVSINMTFTTILTGYNNLDAGNVSSKSITGLSPNTMYYARVRAYDAAGNISVNSSMASGMTSMDTQAPTVPASVTLTNAVPNSLTLNWSASTDNAGVTGYKIDVSTSSIFSSYVAGYNGKDVGNILTSLITGLASSTTYYARVRAYDASSNTSGNSTTATGQTAPPDTQAPTAPGNPTASNVTAASFTLNWTAATDNIGVTGYKIDIAKDSGFTNFVAGYNNKDAGNVLTTSIAGLSPLTPYYARVRAYDAAGNISTNSSSLNISTVADTQAPSAPANPAFTNVTLTGLTLNWSASTDNIGVTGYKIDIAKDSGFTNFVTGYNGKDVSNVLTSAVTGLTPATPYYGRVRAYDAAGNVSSNSTAVNGTTTADTQAPTTPLNPAIANITPVSFTFNWSASTDNVAVTTYKIDVAKDSGFTNLLTGYNGKDVGNVLTTSVTGLIPSTPYYARVRAYDAAGNASPNSPAVNVTTTADNQAPTAPGNPAIASVSPTSFSLNWSAATDNTGVTTYKIDVATDSGFTNFVTGYNGQDVGNVLSAFVTGLTQLTQYYARVRAYDAAGNASTNSSTVSVKTVPVSVNYVKDLQYNEAGLTKSITYANGVVTNYTYDANLRLKTIRTLDSGGVVLQDLTYTYDGVGNIINIADKITGQSKIFVYDELNRLVQAEGNYGANQSNDILSLAYSPGGNITGKDNQNYSYTPSQPHSVRGVGNDAFGYDANGNMSTKTSGGITTTYNYDAENQLASVVMPGSSAQYSYDDSGDRIRKSANSLVTKFVDDIYEEGTQGSKSYVFIAGMRVASLENVALKYYHQDHLGGTNVITNSTGAVLDRADYKPFGEFTQHTAPTSEGHFYTDQ
ncbi:MAG: fibronectin type III domain-containing protein [Candidatus Omnitrophica bacterium]|nr:fibronectin type III domain-containing protein [Candidatus Omnitrophota bacterium]